MKYTIGPVELNKGVSIETSPGQNWDKKNMFTISDSIVLCTVPFSTNFIAIQKVRHEIVLMFHLQ